MGRGSVGCNRLAALNFLNGEMLMATYRVGQRVRVVDCEPDAFNSHRAIGKEGSIVEVGDFLGWGGLRFAYRVVLDFDPRGVWRFNAKHLAPITDTGADAFIERIKKLKPYDEPVVAPSKITTR